MTIDPDSDRRAYASYGDLMRDVSAKLDENNIETALNLLSDCGPRFASQLSHVYLFRASLTNRLGRSDEAIALLREARSTGARFPATLLHGSKGLASLAGNAAFEELVAQFDAAYQVALREGHLTVEVHRPDGAQPDEGWPLLLALHGNRSTVELEREQWTSALEQGWMVALPGSSMISWTPGYFVWDDAARARRDVIQALAEIRRTEVINPTRIVLSGFSAGGLRAIEFALDPELGARGLITVAAFLTDELVDAFAILSVTALRAYLLIGTLDTTLPSHHKLAGLLMNQGIEAVLDVRDGMGHVYPDDMSLTLARALTMVDGHTLTH